MRAILASVFAAILVCGVALFDVAAQQGQDVPYISGGVGEDEFASMKQAEKDYPLSLMFTQGARGEYLAGVRVAITDKAGKPVLRAVSKGPMMLVKLPPGDYVVTAESDGRTQNRSARIGAQGQTKLTFNWPQG